MQRRFRTPFREGRLRIAPSPIRDSHPAVPAVSNRKLAFNVTLPFEAARFGRAKVLRRKVSGWEPVTEITFIKEFFSDTLQLIIDK